MYEPLLWFMMNTVAVHSKDHEGIDMAHKLKTFPDDKMKWDSPKLLMQINRLTD